jgi:hypothetical protein
MTNEQLQRVMGSLLVRSMPSEIRRALYADSKFCSDVGIRTAASSALGNDVSVQSASLLKAIRAAIDGRKAARLKLANGKEVRAKLSVSKGKRAIIHLDKHGYVFDDADLLATSRTRRHKALERALKTQPLLKDEDIRWRRLTSTRRLDKDEFVELMTSFERTPEALAAKVTATPQLTIEVLIPSDPKYYSRLLAPPPESSVGVREYIAKGLADARQHVLATNVAAGLRRIAYSNLWQPLIPFEILSPIEFSKISALADAFDPFSLLFGFELCAAKLALDKSYEALSTTFLQALFDDHAALRRRCQIFSACAVVATVILRSTFDESSVPLHWFRLAALTHAGLLTNALRALSEPSQFLDWAITTAGNAFFWHVLYDRRDAPRWRSEWISPEQIEAELFGRVLNAIGLLPKDRRPKPWQKIIDEFAARLQVDRQAITSQFAGPLDDFGDSPPVPPDLQAIVAATETRLQAATKPSDATKLTGLAYLIRPTDKMVTELIRLFNVPHVDTIDVEILDTCAHIAACARSESLARPVINHCLRAVRSSSSESQIAEFYTAILEACAAVADPKAYRQFVGESSTGLILNIPKSVPMAGLRATLELLTHRDPKLFSILSRSSANLEAVEMRR